MALPSFEHCFGNNVKTIIEIRNAADGQLKSLKEALFVDDLIDDFDRNYKRIAFYPDGAKYEIGPRDIHAKQFEAYVTQWEKLMYEKARSIAHFWRWECEKACNKYLNVDPELARFSFAEREKYASPRGQYAQVCEKFKQDIFRPMAVKMWVAANEAWILASKFETVFEDILKSNPDFVRTIFTDDVSFKYNGHRRRRSV